MPRRELKHLSQIESWLVDWGRRVKSPGEMVLIGSGALLWHAAQRDISTPLPENSMDVDPVTTSEEIGSWYNLRLARLGKGKSINQSPYYRARNLI